MAKETAKTAPAPPALLSEFEKEEMQRDDISRAVGHAFYVARERFDWLRDAHGGRISVGRYYPKKQVVTDKVTGLPPGEVERRRETCAQQGILYIPLERDDPVSVSAEKIRAAMEARK